MTELNPKVAGTEFGVPAFYPEDDYAVNIMRAVRGDNFMEHLPGVYVSYPLDGEFAGGRDIEDYYSTETDDEEGWVALKYGARYYREAMTYQDPAQHDLRVECFRAAELLYLHAWHRGNAVAALNLGYIYSYDRCEGRYWENTVRFLTEDWATKVKTREEYRALQATFPREARAYECYRFAAQTQDPEACYKLGDMLRAGTGCVADAAEAFAWYTRAYELGKRGAAAVWGSAAYRLATCCEEGEGCEQSFEAAHKWYKLGVAGLQAAVNGGQWFYTKVLERAKRGLARVEQELRG